MKTLHLIVFWTTAAVFHNHGGVSNAFQVVTTTSAPYYLFPSHSPLINVNGRRRGLNNQQRVYYSNDRTTQLHSKKNSSPSYGWKEKRAQEIATRDLSSDNIFPPILLPIAETIDSNTGGWALSYADLEPENESTPIGRAFLATNICYAIVGAVLVSRGELLLGGLTEIAGIVSYFYHYNQLKLGQNRSEVRLALLIDYFSAGSALLTGFIYILQIAFQGEGISIPIDVYVTSTLALGCLGLCWVYEYGNLYLFWHSLWHIFSAYVGYEVGQLHIEVEAAKTLVM